MVPADVQICIRKLIDEHDRVNISTKNRYLFTIPRTPFHEIRHPSVAYILLKAFASECGASSSKLLTATRLRKQLATSCFNKL